MGAMKCAHSASRNHRRDHPEQAARDCWLELNAAVTLNSKYMYSEKRFNKQGSRLFIVIV